MVCERVRRLLMVLYLSIAGCGEPPANKTGFVADTPEQNAEAVYQQLTSSPVGRKAADRLGSKDDQLTAFQRLNGISDTIAEAAIKEWVLGHSGNFDWDLEEVKVICLRLKKQ